MKGKEFRVIELFSTPLMEVKVNLDENKILNILKNLKYKPSYLPETYISKSNKILENKQLKKEKNIFKDCIQKYLDVLSYNKEFKILNSWSTKTEINAASQPHVHKNTWMSAVYYPESNDGFSISFIRNMLDNYFFHLEYENNYNKYSNTEWVVKPNKDILLIFPSNLQHKINLNTSDKTRYSISFNILPVGVFNKGADIETTYE